MSKVNLQIEDKVYRIDEPVFEEIKKAFKEIERLNNIINHTRRTLGEYKHYSTPTEEQNKENEDIVDKAYMELCINLKELKGSDKSGN